MVRFVREFCEWAVLGVGTGWVALDVVSRGVAQGQAVAGMVLGCFGVLTWLKWRSKFPKEWLQAARTCPDNGVIYGGLIAMMVGGLAGEVQGQYARFVLFGACLCCLQFVLNSVLYKATSSLVHVVGLTGFGILMWTVLVSPTSTVSIVSWFHMFAILSINNGLTFLWIKALGKSFTIGEAMLVIQGLTLVTADFLIYSLQQFLLHGQKDLWVYFDGAQSRTGLSIALEGGLLGVLAIPCVLYNFFKKHAVLENETVSVDPRSGNDATRRRLGSQTIQIIDWSSRTLTRNDIIWFYGVILFWLIAIVSPWVTVLLDGTNPIIWVRDYTFSSQDHAFSLLFWIGTLALGLPLIHKISSSTEWPLIITRKLYHLLALVMFMPVLVVAPDFLALSFGIAAALFLLIEYIRICQVPPFGNWIHFYLRSYTDSRDEGTAILTHIYLLVGCSASLWVYPSSSPAVFGGLVILGAGDAAGAIVGSTMGKIQWPGGRKTFEGTAAALLASLLTLSLIPTHNIIWPVALLATSLTCILEAFTKQIDNLTLPIFYSTLLALQQLPGIQ